MYAWDARNDIASVLPGRSCLMLIVTKEICGFLAGGYQNRAGIPFDFFLSWSDCKDTSVLPHSASQAGLGCRVQVPVSTAEMQSELYLR